VRRGAPLGVALVMALVAWLAPRRASAQGQIQFVLPSQVPFPAAPQIGVRAVGFPASSGPLQIRLRISLSANLGLVLSDQTKPGPQATFTVVRLLPENRAIFAEASVYDQAGVLLQQLVILAGTTGRRLELVDPSGTTSVALNTQQPRFRWRSASVTSPPGPWVYDLFITNVATQDVIARTGIVDTIYDYPDTLQANTSYRWRVHARLVTGDPLDSVSVASQSSFVISPSNQPLTTLLYQNFPNPFPAPSSSTTCMWFDLRTPSEVDLMIYDLRGNPIRRMLPSAELRGVLPAGRYGRLRETESSGCDPRFAWDGTADNGRMAPPGIYLVRFRAEGYESMKKMLFRGR
jgi:hypothetical protein